MSRVPTRSLAPERKRGSVSRLSPPLTGHFIGRVFWDTVDAGGVGKRLFADVCLIRTRQGSRVLIDPILALNDDGVAAA
jgi:hypothetical protein